jgi:hypothetical protein
MSKLFIPAIGDRITLVQPWQFNLYLEHRNISYARLLGLAPSDARWNVYVPNTNYQLAIVKHSIDAGTVLECDRIYIKSNSKQAKSPEDSYDSITWKIIVNDKTARNQRFWVKLFDCNSMEFDPLSISKYQDRK